MSAKYKSPSFLLPNEKNTSLNPSLSADRASNYSMDFDGSSYVDAGNADELNITESITISAWVKTSSNSTDRCYLSKRGTSGNAYQISQYTSKVIGLSIWIGGVRKDLLGTTNHVQNVWYHVVGTYDGSYMRVYVNGVEENNQAQTGSIDTTTNSFRIAAENYSSTYWFNGQIDEVAIFNRALNTTEIAALYEGTSPNIYPSNLMATNLNPVAYYPLGEQAQNSGYLSASGNEWQFPNGVLQDYVMDFSGLTTNFEHINVDVNLGNTFTISGWFNIDAFGAVVLQQSGSPETYALYFRTATEIRTRFNGSNSVSFYVSTISTGKWTNFIIVRSGDSQTLYINGVSAGTTSGAGTGDFTLQKIGGYSWDGRISNVAAWNTAITNSAQIANIYNNGSPQTTYTVTPQNWWKLNADSVYTPSAPNYTTALDFIALESDYIDTLYTGLNGVSQATISFWLNSSNVNQNGHIFGNRTGNTGLAMQFFTNNTSYIYINGETKTFTTSSYFSNNTWHNFILVFDGSLGTNDRLKAYVDGDLITFSSVSSTTLLTSTNNFLLGFAPGGAYFNGSLSNVAIYNTALTSSQVSTLFNFGTPETNISFSPQAWWKLDDQNAITDSSGNGNTGTNNGASQVSSPVAVVPSWKIPSALTTPTINYTSALDFVDSTLTSVQVGTNSAFNFGKDDSFTLSAWVYSHDGGGMIFSKMQQSGTYAGYSLGIENASQGIRVSCYIYPSWYIQTPNTSSSTFALNEWAHIAMTYDGSSNTSGVKLYINGENIAHPDSNAITTNFNNNTAVPRISNRDINSGNNSFDGLLSNVAVFNSALTNSQISTLFNSGQPETAISFSPVGWWKLDNKTTGIQDSSGNGNNGTLSTNEPTQVTTDVKTSDLNIPVNGVSTTLPSTALQQSDLQFDSPYSNYSLNFDGTGDYINCGNNVGLSEISSMAFSNWVKYDNPSQANTWRVSMGNCYWNTYGFSTGIARTGIVPSGGVQPFFTLLSSSGTTNKIGGQNSTSNATSLNPLIANTWYHVAGTWDGTTMKLFINGVIHDYKTFSSSWTLDSTTATFFIGSGASGSNSSFPTLGNVDEVALWLNKTLTDAEILQIYNNGKPNDISSLSPTNWWRLGENAYFDNNSFVVPNSISGAPNGTGFGTVTTMISADAPGTYANGIGTNLDIVDRVGDAPLSIANSQSYNIIPDDKVPYVPEYVGKQIANNFSMTFDGVDDYFDAGTGLGNTLGSSVSDMTVSLWYKNITGNNQGLLSIISSNTAGNTDPFAIFYNNNSIYVGFGTSNREYTQTLDSNWHHLLVVKNGTNLSTYIDGSSVSPSAQTGSIPATIDTTNKKTFIGLYWNTSYTYNGFIDEVAIFDTALNAGQIYNDIYQPTATGTNQTADLVNNPNLPTPVAWYRMGD